MSQPYSSLFYGNQRNGSARSAAAVVPFVFSLLSPKTVLDVGCGTGAFLGECQKAGAEIFGIDGPWAEKNLVIGNEFFKAVALEKGFDLGKKYDLAISLEVAEHIETEASGIFLDSLTRHADVILFSAAIPGQGGTEHVNERWQSFWIDEFAKRGYRACDAVRTTLWNDGSIEPWYVQNAFLFFHQSVSARETYASLLEKFPVRIADVVHPNFFTIASFPYRMAFRFVPSRLRHALSGLLRPLIGK